MTKDVEILLSHRRFSRIIEVLKISGEEHLARLIELQLLEKQALDRLKIIHQQMDKVEQSLKLVERVEKVPGPRMKGIPVRETEEVMQ